MNIRSTYGRINGYYGKGLVIYIVRVRSSDRTRSLLYTLSLVIATPSPRREGLGTLLL